MKIAIGYNTSHYAWMFRANLIKELIKHGHSVIVIAPLDDYSQKLEALGAKHINIAMKMNKNPVTDLLLCFDFYRLFKQEKPDVFFGYTIKPNIYGSLAAQNLQIPCINNIAGLGASFINNNVVTSIVKFLYKLGLYKSYKIFFQNKDDLALFRSERILTHDRFDVLPGSGVNLQDYQPCEIAPIRDDPTFQFLLIARMLWDKGVGEYIQAARILRKKKIACEFSLLGAVDVQNPAAISSEQIQEWVDEGVVKYLGVSADPRIEIAKIDCVVLPSYREGTPRVLLEAAAMGKPLITTDAVGCKEAVDHSINGFLCRVRDSEDLAQQMLTMVEVSQSRRDEMGKNGRKKMETQFDETIVLNKYIQAINSI